MKVDCPKCNELIEELDLWEGTQEKSWFKLDEDGNVESGFVEQIFDDQIDFECPICGATLFHVEEEAANFLRGIRSRRPRQ